MGSWPRRYFTVGVVCRSKILFESRDDRVYFLEPRITSCWQGIICKVQISSDLLKLIPSDSVSDWRVVQVLAVTPVIPDLWQPVDTHEYHKAKVCPDLFCIGRPLFTCALKRLLSIPVGLIHNMAYQTVIKKERKKS